MKLRSRSLIVAVAAILALGACSSSDDDDQQSDTPSQQKTDAGDKPSTDDRELGDVVKGSGYSLSIPKGWAANSDIPEQADLQAADQEGTGDFTSNVNVVISYSATPDNVLDQIERMVTPQLQSAGGHDITINDRVTVAGREAVHASASVTPDDATYAIEQFCIPGDSQIYIVTFTFDEGIGEKERAQIYRPVLDSWSWD